MIQSTMQSKSAIAQHNTPIAATPSPTATLSPTPQDAHEPLFSDFFFDNSKGWATGDATGYTRTISDGHLMLAATNHKVLVESLPPINTFTSVNDFKDFSITTTFTLMQADQHDSVGLYLRGDSNLDHDYQIVIYGNASFAINKEWLDETKTQKTTALVDPTPIPSLRPLGQQNTLTAVMKGSTLVLKLNGSVITSLEDSDYTHGQIALFVEHGSTSNGVKAMFSSVEIYPAPEELP